MKRKKLFSLFLLVLLTITLTACGGEPAAEDGDTAEPEIKDLILSTTTSTQDSGLLDELIPIFEEETGYLVKTIAVGTGKALEMASLGEADVLLVHAPDAEKEVEAAGDVINRQLVMHNDFVLVGPAEDPQGLRGLTTAQEAFTALFENETGFVTRGDDSGTDKMEKGIWADLGLEPEGAWYIDAGSGMADTLKIASEKGAYTLTDRGTYLALKDTLDLDILFEGDEILLNIYHVMQVNPEKFANINAEGGQAFVKFMVAKETQDIIGEFGVDRFGSPLFFPDAK
ncbi:MAG: tungsten ABC transporter substrate-binding protein [Firmicutes bacterium]|nr:tungsten ABC transporter substrate-binding protein [Bacillota bacterium]